MRHHDQAHAGPGGILTEGASDIALICALAALVFVAAGTWLTGQLAALLFLGRWPSVSFTMALGVAFRLPGHLADPRLAWPAAVRPDLPGAAPFAVCAVLALSVLSFATVLVVRWRLRHRTQRGYASPAEIRAVLSERAVIARGPVVRPSLRRRSSR